MAKRMLADVLWEAANEHLASGAADDGCIYTCEAIAMAARHPWAADCSDDPAIWLDFIEHHPSMHFVRELGCDPKHGGRFIQFHCEEQRQGVRYMWLLLAMHVAEDEGIEL